MISNCKARSQSSRQLFLYQCCQPQVLSRQALHCGSLHNARFHKCSFLPHLPLRCSTAAISPRFHPVSCKQNEPVWQSWSLNYSISTMKFGVLNKKQWGSLLHPHTSFPHRWNESVRQIASYTSETKTANRGSRLLNRVSYTLCRTQLRACCHPPTCRQESTRITEVILKCLKSLGLDCFFKAAFNKPVEFIETQNKGKVLPPCVGSCFTMLWPPNKPETILY